jgi:hypothetical protein
MRDFMVFFLTVCRGVIASAVRRTWLVAPFAVVRRLTALELPCGTARIGDFSGIGPVEAMAI